MSEEKIMSNKTLGTISILAAGLALFSALLNPKISLTISVLALVGLGLWQLFSPKRHSDILENVRMLTETKTGLIEKQAEEKRHHKDAILNLLNTQGRLTNNQIERMLGISDATATRYLDELEKEGKVRQVGKTGQSVYYEKISSLHT